MQVLLQLPGGQTVPVHIPAAVAMVPNAGQDASPSAETAPQVAPPAVPITTTATPVVVTPTTPSTVSTSTITKQVISTIVPD